MRVTVEYLESLRDEDGFPPCQDHLGLFEDFLGDRRWVLPTERNLALALEDYGLDVRWFIGATGWTGVLEHPERILCSGKKHTL
jgi:hypothetical protein